MITAMTSTAIPINQFWPVLQQQKLIRDIDVQLARLCAQWESQPLVLLAVALVSLELGRGHVCLSLRHWQDRLTPWLAAWQDLAPDIHTMVQHALMTEDIVTLLQASPLVHHRTSIAGITETGQPLTLFAGRLYLSRYFRFEQRVAIWLQQQAEQPASSLSRMAEQLFPALFPAGHFPAGHFPAGRSDAVNWQAVAAITACHGRFTLISGGPGTGKTTTVTKLLALLVADSAEAPLIRLSAPTGKAAARLTESIAKAKGELTGQVSEKILAQIPTQASTLHRLLGVRMGSPEFRHHRNNPLPLDILVVDEASMVDLPMMARLLDAMPEHARLVLLGDRDQLASVEAGAVLGDICQLLGQGISPEHARRIQSMTGYSLDAEICVQSQGHPLRDHLCLLRHSYRFNAKSGIGTLALAVNTGSVRDALAVCQHPSTYPDVLWETSVERLQIAIQRAADGYRHYLTHLDRAMTDELAVTMLADFNQLRILCATHEGPWGVDGMNDAIRKELQSRQQIFAEGEWFAGRPVMITENDYHLGLYNGDIGVTASDGQRLKVWFMLPDGGIQGFLPSRLPAHETAWAMTVHKSQGSEFEHTLLVLPPQYHPLLTRELLYTGITRAKRQLDLYADETVVRMTIQKQVERHSGLLAMLGVDESS